jgi:hypothetical protein
MTDFPQHGSCNCGGVRYQITDTRCLPRFVIAHFAKNAPEAHFF